MPRLGEEGGRERTELMVLLLEDILKPPWTKLLESLEWGMGKMCLSAGRRKTERSAGTRLGKLPRTCWRVDLMIFTSASSAAAWRQEEHREVCRNLAKEASQDLLKSLFHNLHFSFTSCSLEAGRTQGGLPALAGWPREQAGRETAHALWKGHWWNSELQSQKIFLYPQTSPTSCPFLPPPPPRPHPDSILNAA